MKTPKLIRDWLKEINQRGPEDVHLERGDLPRELECDGDWEKVDEFLVGECKYNNVSEAIWKYVPTGQFFRFETHSLPYGITDYGMAPEDENDIEEVFPVQVTVTRYLTRKEQRKGVKA